jgi:hypothetical protein
MQEIGPHCSECKHRRLGCSKSIPMEDREASGSAHMVLNATVEPEVAILEGMIDFNVSSVLPWTLHTCCYSSMDCLTVSLYHYRHGMVCCCHP